ncbi:unnamed protein product [Linum tenue]|uniref:Uncharacterized protein n=1 Tax=Linum tenue TaxID=586396 RepID=A0AAV0HLH1_9ROSI|nr:unnamed protein product [Linum tenue]
MRCDTEASGGGRGGNSRRRFATLTITAPGSGSELSVPPRKPPERTMVPLSR